MSGRRGSWTRSSTVPAHAIAARQQRGQQLAARTGRRDRDAVPVRGKAGSARPRRDGRGAR
jgi:hypothetical protein